jgi:uncharacterized protein YhbP (UPF0306 family)
MTKDLLKEYLPQQHMMQLATVADGQPWCCTVYYVHDADYNLYWASLPTRRHSQEIAAHPKVAAAIAIKHVKGEKVVGIQVAGTAEMLEPSPTIEPLALAYAEKFGRDETWVADFVAGQTEHRLYKLTSAEIVIFDEVNFPHNTRLQVLPT